MEPLTLKETTARTKLSRTSIYKLINHSDFPKPIKLGTKCLRFAADEVDAWMESRRAARDEKAAA